MPANRVFRSAPFERESLPLDSARTAFRWLVTGPEPLWIDGRFFPGLPRRRIALDELSTLLRDPQLALATVDSAWVHLVTRSRDEGGAWTVACVGLALHALIPIVAKLCRKYADDHHDIHAAVLTGFLSELAHMDLARPWVLWRLRCAALRAGHVVIRDALDRPTPTDQDFHSNEPTLPWGHEDFVLARAVAEGVITGEQAELIGATRLEPEYTLTQAAADRGVSYKAIEQVRRRAEHKLAAWLAEQAPHDDSGERRDRDVEVRAVHATTIIAAARTAARRAARPATSQPDTSRTVMAVGGKSLKKVRGRVLKKTPKSGVQGCGRKAAAPAHTTSPTRPAGTARRPSGTTPGVPRCA
jgi:hypothetical protein